MMKEDHETKRQHWDQELEEAHQQEGGDEGWKKIILVFPSCSQ
jgi:hypothetical protein